MCRFVIVFILLHVMVYSFGFMNYNMKVTLGNTRLILGQLNASACSLRHHIFHRPSSRVDITCRRGSNPFTYSPFKEITDYSCLSRINFPPPTNSIEQHHRLRQKYHLPQTHSLVDRLLLLGPHYRPLDQLCPFSHRNRNRNQGFRSYQLPHRTRSNRLCHANSTHGNGFYSNRKTSSKELRTILVYSSFIPCILLCLVFSWGVLYD